MKVRPSHLFIDGRTCLIKKAFYTQFHSKHHLFVFVRIYSTNITVFQLEISGFYTEYFSNTLFN